MNPYLRDKLLQKLETVSDERGYQVLDYVEFLESKYAEKQPAAGAASTNPLSRFADAVEEKLRAGRVSASTIAETMSLMNKAVGVLNGAAAAGKSVASDLMSATSRVVEAAAGAPSVGTPSSGGTTGATTRSAAGSANQGGATPPAGTTPADGSTSR
ncbi:MAG: hypothetical protein ABI601_10855 [bacterium]